MTPERFRQADLIFRAAVERPPVERSSFIAQACAGDGELRAQVELLIQHDAEPQLETQSPVAGALRRMGDELFAQGGDIATLPERIGSYRVLKLLGEGGFGIVYLAEQTSPKRQVAIKVLRGSIVSPGILRRFEHEADILARLRHPGIAQIYEASVAGSGPHRQPFFAMEYVEGRDLLEYASSAGPNASPLTIRERLLLFLRVCAAVQHAHQCSVIHRDLKPANIIVATNDFAGPPPQVGGDVRDREPLSARATRPGGRGSDVLPQSAIPKILDFGVARLTDADAAITMQTGAGQLIGTLAYMSPEQVSGDPARVDTRSDVYALGVILYQLLTGRLPHELTHTALPDAIRVIRDDSPPPLRTFDPTFRGDLDAIVSKALEKDVHRRYPSVAHLAGDIEAYLAQRPVSARGGSALYHVRKLASRHRRLVAVAALALAALVLGSIGTAWQAVRATRARDRARMEVRKSQRVTRFLQNMLASADPNVARGREISVRELLDQSAARVHVELADEPELEAAVRYTIAETYRGLALYPQAETHLRESLAIRERLLGPESVEAVDTMYVLATVLNELHQHDEALQLAEKTLVRLRQFGRKDIRSANTLVLLADLRYVVRGEFHEAEAAYREAIEIYTELSGPKSEHRAAALGNLGGMLVAMFHYADAEPVLREAYELSRELHGPDHSVVIMNANNLAALLAESGRESQAEPIARAALDSAQRIFSEDHTQTARIMTLVAEFALINHQWSEAERLARAALASRQKSLPADHAYVAASLSLLAEVLAASSDPASAPESMRLAEQAVSIYHDRNEDKSWPAANARHILGVALAALGNYESAGELLTNSLEDLKLTRGPKSRAVRNALRRMIRACEKAGDHEQVLRLQESLDAIAPR